MRSRPAHHISLYCETVVSEIKVVNYPNAVSYYKGLVKICVLCLLLCLERTTYDEGFKSYMSIGEEGGSRLRIHIFSNPLKVFTKKRKLATKVWTLGPVLVGFASKTWRVLVIFFAKLAVFSHHLACFSFKPFLLL